MPPFSNVVEKPESSKTRERRGFGRRFERLLPWIVLIVFLIPTFLMWKAEFKNSIAHLQNDFDFRVRDTNSRIVQRMTAYEQVLRGVQGSFAAFGGMGRDEFRTYVSTLELGEVYPGVQGIGFETILPLSQKDSFIASVRKEGFPDYLIKPEGLRDHYTPTLYMEPLNEINQRMLGFDNSIDPVRRTAMERARDDDLPIISGKIFADDVDKDLRAQHLELKDTGQTQASFRMFLPVFKKGALHDTLANRQANIMGWIFSQFRMEELMEGILGEHATEIDIEIHDGEDMSEKAVMYDPDSSGNVGWENARFHTVNRIEIGGHYWTVAVRSLEPFERQLDLGKPKFVAISGVALSIILALFTGLLTRSRARALQAAYQINRELVERKRAEEGLRLAGTVLNTVEEAVLVSDSDNSIISVNPAFTTITGYDASEVIGKNPRILSSGKHPPEFYREMWDTLLSTGAWHGEVWDRRKDGQIYIKWLTIKVVLDENQKLAYYMAVFTDITERKAAEERMQFIAHHDALTGLPNRSLFTDRLQQSVAKAKREKACMALMFIDLDKFKPVNDTFGHAVGDMLLKEVAKRLQHCIMRESDTAARLGGDEFVVLLPSVEKQQDAQLIADKILNALNQPFELAGHSLNISASIGIAVYPEHGNNERKLTQNADIAMYYAKGNGRNNAVIYDPQSMKEISNPDDGVCIL